MAKLAVLGQNTARLVDCSEVIPVPVAPAAKSASYPAGKTSRDIQQACPSPFPALKTDGEYPRFPCARPVVLICSSSWFPDAHPGLP